MGVLAQEQRREEYVRRLTGGGGVIDLSCHARHSASVCSEAACAAGDGFEVARVLLDGRASTTCSGVVYEASCV